MRSAFIQRLFVGEPDSHGAVSTMFGAVRAAWIRLATSLV
jgi:hypothetical protein